jgi:hypothetical protein
MGINTKIMLACVVTILASPPVVANPFSGEPSQSEVRRALQTYTNQNPAIEFVRTANAFKLHNVEKLSCKSEGSRAYICHLQITASSNLTGTITGVERYLFLKNSQGWFVQDKLD